MSFDEAIRRGTEAAEAALAKAREVDEEDDVVVVALGAYEVETAALDACEAGLSVIRVATDGSKKPLGLWKRWQDTAPTRSQVAGWFGDGHPAMGIVTGKVSGNLEMLEFEGRANAEGVVGQFKELLRAAGLFPEWERIVKGYSERTPSEGFHVLWRCPEIDHNTKLARRPATAVELAANGNDKVMVLIETRGEGGFVVCAPTTGAAHPTGKPWVRLHGSFDTIATIHPELRRRILDVARQLDQLPDEEPERAKPVDERGDSGTLPGFGLQPAEVLQTAGFKHHHTDRAGNTHWTRPGKPMREGSSLTVWADDGRATPWSSSIAMPGEFLTGRRLLTAWQLHVALNHQGDFTAAARAWRQAHPGSGNVREVDELLPMGVDPETGEIIARPAAVLPEEFWAARPALAHIRQAAHSRRRSADACLHIVLARVSASTSHTTHLPAVVGAVAPLCYFAAIVAAPGVGKSSANGIASELVTAPDWVQDDLPLGSGEGLAEVLFEMVEERDDEGKKRVVKRQTKHNAFVFVDEGQMLGDIGGRSGATLLPTLRTIWTGGTFGNTNASIERRRIVPARSYTYGVVAAFQASRAGGLIDDADAGTPQRFGWASAVDPTIPDDAPPWPGPLEWKQPVDVLGGRALTLSDAIRQEIDAADLARARGQVTVNALDAHGGLYRLKVAGLLAILDGRRDVTDEDWALAGVVKATSDAVRDGVLAAVAAQRAEAERAASDRHARRHVAAAEADENRRVLECARGIRRKVSAEPDRWTRSELRRSMRRWREVFDDALDHALDEGWVTEEIEPGQGTDRRSLRPAQAEGVDGVAAATPYPSGGSR